LHFHFHFYNTEIATARLSLSGVAAYHTPKNWPKRPKLDGPAYEYTQRKMAGVHVRRKTISRRTVWRPLYTTREALCACIVRIVNLATKFK